LAKSGAAVLASLNESKYFNKIKLDKKCTKMYGKVKVSRFV
jgi:hypothetical protein